MVDFNSESTRGIPYSHLRRWTRSYPTLTAGGLLFVLALIFFGTQLPSPDAFLYRPRADVSDLTITFWPNITYIQHSLKTYGELPLWRTQIFSGSPFDVDPQSGLWYLPNLIFLILPATAGFNLLFVLHLVLGGVGLFTWSRATGMGFAAAFFAAVAYAFTPRVVAHIGAGHAGLVYAAAYIPWALYAVERIASGRWRYAGLLGLGLGMQIIAHVQITLYTVLACAVYFAYLWIREIFEPAGLGDQAVRDRTGATGIWRFISKGWVLAAGFTLGGVLALITASVQLLPLASFAPLSARSSMGFGDSTISSLPLSYLWGTILADYTGYMDYLLYAGIAVWALVFFSLGRHRARFWGWFILAVLLYALGPATPLFEWTAHVLPFLTWVRAPSRLWIVAVAPLALLSGWGLERLGHGISAPKRRWLNLSAVFLAALAISLPTGYALIFGMPPTNLVALGLLVSAAALLVVGMAAQRISLQVGALSFLLLLLVDLWILDATLIEGRRPQAILADNGAVAFLSRFSGTEPFRVYSPSYSVPRHLGVVHGLESADGVDPLFLSAYDHYFEDASGVDRSTYGVTIPAMEGGEDETDLLLVNRNAVPDAKLLGLLNVRFVASEFPISAEGLDPIAQFGRTHIYENRELLPRAFVVGTVEPVLDFESALQRIDKIDLKSTALVENGRSMSAGQVQAEIVWLHRSPNRLEISASLDRSGFLVLSQIHYPGWRAQVDGEPVELQRTNGVLNGLYLSPGEHDISLVYRPRWLWLGLSLSLLGLIVCLGLLLHQRRIEETAS